MAANILSASLAFGVQMELFKNEIMLAAESIQQQEARRTILTTFMQNCVDNYHEASQNEVDQLNRSISENQESIQKLTEEIGPLMDHLREKVAASQGITFQLSGTDDIKALKYLKYAARRTGVPFNPESVEVNPNVAEELRRILAPCSVNHWNMTSVLFDEIQADHYLCLMLDNQREYKIYQISGDPTYDNAFGRTYQLRNSLDGTVSSYVAGRNSPCFIASNVATRLLTLTNIQMLHEGFYRFSTMEGGLLQVYVTPDKRHLVQRLQTAIQTGGEAAASISHVLQYHLLVGT